MVREVEYCIDLVHTKIHTIFNIPLFIRNFSVLFTGSTPVTRTKERPSLDGLSFFSMILTKKVCYGRI